MNDYTLCADRLAQLRTARRETRDKREADCIKALVLLGTGWSAEQVVEVPQVDPNTVRNHVKRYQQIAFRGSVCALDEAQLAALDLHLQTHLYQTANGVAAWVKDNFKVGDSESGMTALMPLQGGSGVLDDLAHQARVPAPVCPQSQSHRATLEAVQEKDALQPLLRNLRRPQSGV